jgi:hypothetical protein
MRRRLLLGLAVVALVGFLAVMLDPTCVLWGLLTRESFYQGRPTSYWRGQIIRARTAEQACSAAKPSALPDLFGTRDRKPPPYPDLDTPEAIPVLLELLEDGSDYVRWHAAFALLELSRRQPEKPRKAGGLSVVPPPRLRERYGPRSELVARALGEALLDEESDTSERALMMLLSVGPEAAPAVPSLVEALRPADKGRPDPSGWNGGIIPLVEGGWVGYILVHIGRPAVPELIKALQDESGDVREEAADILGHIGPDAREAVPALCKALSDPLQNVRSTAAHALKRIDPDAAPGAEIR